MFCDDREIHLGLRKAQSCNDIILFVVCCEGETKSYIIRNVFIFVRSKVNVFQIIMIYTCKSKVHVYQTCDIYPFNPKVKEGKLQVLYHIFANPKERSARHLIFNMYSFDAFTRLWSVL